MSCASFFALWDVNILFALLVIPISRELDEEMQTAVRDYLEERGVNDELAAFLHTDMENKEQTELVALLHF